MSQQQIIGAGGEEWRAMESSDGAYDPSGSDSLLRDARANIEKLRKSDVELRLVDRRGQPLANRTIRVEQTRHAFPFGDNLWGIDRFARDGQWETDKARYARRRFSDLLNAANALCYWTERPRNDGSKTEDLQGEPRYEAFARCVDWAAAEGLIVKGHPLCWSIPKCTPDWVMRYDHETRMKFLEVRIRSLVARFKGKIKLWDAVNEAMWEPAFVNLDQRDWPHVDPIDQIADYISPVLKWCREEDPDAVFTINDYGMETDPPNGPPKTSAGNEVTAAFQRDRFIQLIAELDRRGTPAGAIGLQSHTGGWLDHRQQWAIYDQFGATGLPVHITEFWTPTRSLRKAGNIPTADLDAMEQQYIENYLTIALGHPAVGAFFFWGVMGNAVKFAGESSSHDITPLYDFLHDLLHHRWSTRESLTTDSDGVIRFRGWHGQYSIQLAPDTDSPLPAIAAPLSVDASIRQPIAAELMLPAV